jgi:HK97 family phage prohead protease
MNSLERRVLQRDINLSAIENGKDQVIDGMASLFNHRSRLIAENGDVFYEVIERGAFDYALQRSDLDVLALVNHDMDKMLGRSSSGTLKLTVNEEGLRYEILTPNTQLGKDTLVMLERGDYFESSFGFYVQRDNVRWSDIDEDGIRTRYISKVEMLIDVSIVRNGAYSNTDVAVRELKSISPTQTDNLKAKNINEYFEYKTKLLKL